VHFIPCLVEIIGRVGEGQQLLSSLSLLSSEERGEKRATSSAPLVKNYKKNTAAMSSVCAARAPQTSQFRFVAIKPKKKEKSLKMHAAFCPSWPQSGRFSQIASALPSAAAAYLAATKKKSLSLLRKRPTSASICC
jgi:hypothetical protein